MTESNKDIAEQVRRWYEQHRESWQDRLFCSDFRDKADDFILDLIAEVLRVVDEARVQEADGKAKRARIKTSNAAGRLKYPAAIDSKRRRRKK